MCRYRRLHKGSLSGFALQSDSDCFSSPATSRYVPSLPKQLLRCPDCEFLQTDLPLQLKNRNPDILSLCSDGMNKDCSPDPYILQSVRLSFRLNCGSNCIFLPDPADCLIQPHVQILKSRGRQCAEGSHLPVCCCQKCRCLFHCRC